MKDRGGRTAYERMQRVLFAACGVGAVVFGVLLLGGQSGILAQAEVLSPPFWWFTVTIAVLLPASFILLAPVLPIRVLRAMAALCIVGFITAQAAWVPGMEGSRLTDGATPWLQGINALPSTLAGALLRAPWLWGFPLLQGPIVVAVQLASGDGTVRDAVLDGVGAWVFCCILTGIALAVVHAARQQDVAADRARQQAAIEASTRTREREQTRINAIVHDDIMSVLISASRHSVSDELATQARAALQRIDEISRDDERVEGYTPAEAVAVLRATVADLHGDAAVTYVLDGDDEVPAETLAALSEALAEAVRNVLHHAGAEASLGVDIRVDSDGVLIAAADDGVGFARSNVSPTRLGIRVSIEERMAMAGGRGVIVSAPGLGTSVELSWSRA